MKTLILPALVASLAILPFQKSEAAKFGDFPAGYDFKLKVDKVVSTKISGFNVTPINVPIPSSIPKFKKGDPIALKITSTGALKSGTKFTIPFINDAGTSNVYNKMTFGTVTKTDSAIIYKSSTNKATSGSLTFIRTSGTAFDLTTNTVTYLLKRP